MVEHMVRTLFVCEFASALRAGGAEHMQPRARASCTAAVPTPPLAPWMRTFSLGSACAGWNNPRYAVAYGVPIAAPWAKEAFAGYGCTYDVLHSAYSAYVPAIEPAT